MIQIEQIKVGDNLCLGLRVDIKPAPLLLIIGEKGVLACGFLNIEASEKLGMAAAVVTGVRTFEDVLKAEVKGLTTEAEKLGIKVGQKGIDALSYLV